MTKKIIILFFVISFVSCSTKHKVFYHGIELSMRPEFFRVYKWNTEDYDKIIAKENSNLLIKETIDNENRVVIIEFLRKGKLSEYTNFPIAKVTYEYLEDKIIETLYDKNEKTLYVDKHMCHYKSIYFLDKNKFIKKVDRISDFETVDPVWSDLDMKPPSKNELKKEFDELFKQYYRDKPLEIEFYKYSYYKLNRLFPISENFTIDTTNYGRRITNFRKINGKIIADTIYVRSLIEEEIENGIKNLTTHNNGNK